MTRLPMAVVGLDLSLTATGIANIRIDTDGAIRSYAQTVTVKPVGDTLADRAWRLRRLTDRIVEECYWVDLVVIEQPAYGATTGHHHDRSGLWWMVVSRIIGKGIDMAEVPPATLKKYAAGKGNAGKDEVLLSVARRLPGFDVANNNEADAAVLAAMGARHLSQPIDDMPALHLTAMDRTRWPESKETK